MRKYIILLIILIVWSANHAKAETVSQKQAQEMARLFFNESAGRVMAPPKLIYNGRKLTTGRLFTPFYVYNNPVGGFVIISAENKAFPILGYSLTENFDPELLGETEISLLTSYAREIELVRYDSQYSYEAEKAWIHYPEYVKSILSANYTATDPKISLSEADDILHYAVIDDAAIYGDIYTPDQWQSMIVDELKVKESVPIWIIGNKDLYPMVVYGRQGDYFRMEMTRRNSWLMRLNATELISSAMVSTVLSPIDLPDDFIEEIPFNDYDIFNAEVTALENSRRSAPHLDVPILEDDPRLLPLGSGHYEIILPAPLRIARVYNLSGSLMRKFDFNGSNIGFIDLSAEGTGFYIIHAIDDNGRSYGLKVYR